MSELDDIRARRAAAERDPRNYTGRMLADIDTLLAHVAALTAERDALREQLQQAQRELAQERAIMNMVPEYIRYLAEWRAGDGRFLVFNEWVAQRVEQAQPQA